MKNKKKVLNLSFCAALAISSSVYANDNNSTNSLGSVDVLSTEVKEDSYTVESMSTSTGLSLSIKDTPQSVTVITSQQIEDLGITTYDELLAHVTGVSIARWDERLVANARGFTIDYYKTDGVTSYVEYNARELDLSLYERVEIVRGANGLTTGVGNPALSINLIRKRANDKKLKGELSLEVDSEGSYSAVTDISTPLNEDGSVRGRFVAKYEDAESYMDGYEKEKGLIYGVIDTDISDTAKISTGFSYEETDKDGIRWGGLPAFYDDGTLTSFDRSLIVSEDWTYWDTEITSIFANYEQYLTNDIRLNLSYSYEEIKEETALFYLAGAVSDSGMYYYTWLGSTEEHTHNIDLNTHIPIQQGDLEHEIVVGATYNINEVTKYDGASANGYISDFDDYDVDMPDSSTLDTYAEPYSTKQSAVYLSSKISLANDLKLIAGARVSNYKYTSEDTSIDTVEYTGEVTPYIGIVYDITDETSLYSSYTSIFQPQEYIDSNGDYLDPIRGNTKEIGLKGEYLDKKLTTSLSIFQTIQENAPEAVDGEYIGTEQVYTTVEGVTSEGIEVDVVGNVTDALTLSFGISNFEAEENDGSKYNTLASRTTSNLSAKYKFNQYTFGGGVTYKSKTYYEDSTYGTITQDPYYLFDAMFGYQVNENIKTQVNISNITDKSYYEGIGTNSMIYGEPRTITASLKYSF